ncbi:hypothetical protein [Streptomyces chartreusis]|uniref:hypothetical protein n=1 Tax=Streptomyces chartreusis TaxID=1969 RepID=UPI003642AEB8
MTEYLPAYDGRFREAQGDSSLGPSNRFLFPRASWSPPSRPGRYLAETAGTQPLGQEGAKDTGAGQFQWDPFGEVPRRSVPAGANGRRQDDLRIPASRDLDAGERGGARSGISGGQEGTRITVQEAGDDLSLPVESDERRRSGFAWDGYRIELSAGSC